MTIFLLIQISEAHSVCETNNDCQCVNVKVKTDLKRKGRGGERRDWAGLWQTWYNVTRGERRELKVTPAMVRHFSS